MKIKERGITLIALIVTIIILLILASVTLNIAISDNGLFSKSKEAVDKYKEAEKNETESLSGVEEELGKLLNEYGGGSSGDNQTPTDEPKEGTIEYAIKQITGNETENTPVKIGEQDVVIPAGFTISTESAEQVSGGIVVKDKNDNEWVWVPCTSYERHDFGKQEGNYSDYSEEMPEDQNASVTKNKGYYIGRYEAGNDGSDNVIIQKDKTPYNNIAIEDCIAKSNSFAVDNSYDTSKMFTTLCSSYAWDSALTFIEQTNSEYATNSVQGNYSVGWINTGLTTAVCNIYDMGGNLSEYTTEYSSRGNYPHVLRGGNAYNYDASGGSAGFRDNLNGVSWDTVSHSPVFGSPNDNHGFRLTLYVK